MPPQSESLPKQWSSAAILHAVRVPVDAFDVHVWHVSFRCDGLLEKGYLAYAQRERESDSSPGRDPRPGFIYCRGGIGRVGMVKMDWLIRFARRDAVIFAPSYRGNEGGEGKEDFGFRDRADAFCAVRLLASLPAVDASQISVYGFSRGGPLALFCGTEPELPVWRVVTHGGVADLAATYRERPDLRKMLRRVTGGTPVSAEQAYRDRSPISSVRKLRVPVLIIHGANDVQVDVSHAHHLDAALMAAHKSHDLWILPGEGHHLAPSRFDRLADDLFSWLTP